MTYRRVEADEERAHRRRPASDLTTGDGTRGRVSRNRTKDTVRGGTGDAAVEGVEGVIEDTAARTALVVAIGPGVPARENSCESDGGEKEGE
jgi:hypothetical protein